MKSKIKISLLIIPLLFSVAACDDTDNVSVEREMTIDTSGLLVEGAGNVGPFNVSFNLEDYVTIEDEPNVNKARIAMLFAANICTYSSIITSGAKEFDQVTGYVRLFSRFELKDIREHQVKKDADYTHVQMAHHFIKSHGKKYDICFFAIQDSSYMKSWESNLDVGYDDTSYYEKTSNHSEWTEKENHKGFDVSANRTVTLIENYLSEIKHGKTPQILYIFGHSRGGAIANLTAKKMIDNGYEVAAYTAASPLTTTSSEASNPKYKHIFNYVNAVDDFTQIPPASWGFKRFGTDICFDIRNYSEQFKLYTGQDLPSYSDDSFIATLFASASPSREQAYVFDEKYTIETSKAFDTQEKVDKYIEDYKNRFDGSFVSLKSFVRFDVTTNSNDKFVVNVVACPGLLSHMVGLGIGAYGLNNAFTTLTIQYYSIISFFAKLAGVDNVMSLKDTISGRDIAFAHFFQSYMTYLYS